MKKRLIFMVVILAFLVQCQEDYYDDDYTLTPPYSDDNGATVKTQTTVEGASKCDKGGYRERNGLYCGFGWKMLDHSGKENFGGAILHYLLMPLKFIGFLILLPFGLLGGWLYD